MESSPTLLKDLMSLKPRELIDWFHTQTPHSLSQDDEKAILKENIGGFVFLEFGTEQYFAQSGVSRGSCSVLASLRTSILKKSKLAIQNACCNLP